MTLNIDFQPGFSCKAFSEQAGEPLFATTVQTDVYLLLEYNVVWEEKAFEKSAISGEVKEWMTSRMKEMPTPRLLLIKNISSARLGKICFFVGVTHGITPRLYAFELQSYEDLLKLDLPAIVAGDGIYQSYLRQEALFIVCTNGRRDPDCARHGIAVYNAMVEAIGDNESISVWQSTHVGGHRFAANMTLLPYGLLFGRVDPESALKVLDSFRRGEIYLPNLRGRASYSVITQAGEHFLRQKTGIMGLDAYVFQYAQEISPGYWKVRFASTELDVVHQLHIAVKKTDSKVFESCRADKQTSIIRHELIEHEIISPN